MIFVPFCVINFSCKKENDDRSDNESSNPYIEDYRNPFYKDISDKETAIQIAINVWTSKYGYKIYKNRPFVAELINDQYWIVKGTLNADLNKDTVIINDTVKFFLDSSLHVGGVPYIFIRKCDGKILSVYHTK